MERIAVWFEHVKYKYAHTHTHHTAMDVKNQRLQEYYMAPALPKHPQRSPQCGREMWGLKPRGQLSDCQPAGLSPDLLLSIRSGELGVNVPGQRSGVSSQLSLCHL